MKWSAALPIALISTSAIAQTTTTNCTTYSWGSTQCVSQTPQHSQGVNWGLINNSPNPAQSTMDAYSKGVQMRQQQETARHQAELARQQALAQQQQTQALAAQRQADELHRAQSLEAARMVTAGDCRGAQEYALSVGNFVLAQQIKDYCAN